MPSRAAALRQLLLQRKLPVVPGCYDAAGASLIQQAGFPAAYMSGYCVAASHGRPDVGLLTMTDMVARGRLIAEAISIPLIVDADTGYGGILNAAETVRAFERAGVAGIQLEDQVTPKKCGSMAGKELVSIADMQQKIRAACAARQDPDTVIIGRTDSLGVAGLDEALRRVTALEEAGADAVMVMDIASEAEMKAVVAHSRKPSIMLPMSALHQRIGRLATVDALERAGFAMVIHPSILLLSAIAAQRKTLAELTRHGGIHESTASFATIGEINELVGLAACEAFGARFGSGDAHGR